VGGEDGQVESRLVTGKTQVAPKVKIIILSNETVGGRPVSRLAKRVKESLRLPLGKVRYFTDSLAVLGKLKTDTGRSSEFVGAQVGEHCGKSVVLADWRLQSR
jgi:hypothetical protein